MLYTLPNMLTILRIGLTPILLYYLLEGGASLMIALHIFIFAAMTDYLDGYLARRFSIRSSWGAFLDPLADKILVLTTFCGFYVWGMVEGWMLLVFIARDLLVTIFRLFFVRQGAQLVTSRLAKWKTTLQFTSIVLILWYLSALQEPQTHWVWMAADMVRSMLLIPLMLNLVVLLTVYTGAIYFIRNYGVMRRW